MAWHKFVREISTTLSTHGGMAKFGMDDGYAIRPPDIVFPALEKFARDVQENCLLEWERTKTEVFTWNGTIPLNATEGLSRAGALVNRVFEP